MSNPNIVYFDLETQRSFRDVSHNKAKMGISVAVTFSTHRNSYRIYRDHELDQLADELIKADLVVGWNHYEFDYGVLQASIIPILTEQTRNLDMMLKLQEVVGHRIGLDVVAKASLGIGKTADGLAALKWWQLYKKTQDSSHFINIAEYCCYDVKVTKAVHEFSVANGYLLYQDKFGNTLKAEVNW